jgi:hypothetical protein
MDRVAAAAHASRKHTFATTLAKSSTLRYLVMAMAMLLEEMEVEECHHQVLELGSWWEETHTWNISHHRRWRRRHYKKIGKQQLRLRL